MPRKPCVILNPNAGSAAQVAGVLSRLSRLDDVIIHLTQRDGHARELARRAVDEGFDLIVAAGGDGTANQVVNGIAPAFDRVTLGIIPLGTGNDLGRSLGLPEDPAGAVEAVLAGGQRRVDLVRASPSPIELIVNHSTAGLSAMAGQKVEDEQKSSWGPLAYLKSAVSAWGDAKGYRIRLVLDEAETLELELYNLVLANGRFVAGGIPIAPEARMDDGLVDIILVPVESFPRLAVLVSQMMLGTHVDHPDLIYRRARRVRIEHPAEMAFTLDGEVVERGPDLFEVLPGALQVIAPPPVEEAAEQPLMAARPASGG